MVLIITVLVTLGGSYDWVKTFVGPRYVFTIELRDDGKNGFILPSRLIIPSAKEAFEAIKVISSAAYMLEK